MVVEGAGMEVEVTTAATAAVTTGAAATSREASEAAGTPRETIRDSPSTGAQEEDTETPGLPGAALGVT